MATIANPRPATTSSDVRFFFISAIVMALVLVAGFSIQLAFGRSSFAAPLYIHVHAFLFFGWTVLYVVQSWLAGTEASVAVHRKLGWLALGWMPAMVFMGCYITIAMVRRGSVPFFFMPAYFLIMDVVGVLSFAGLATAAIVMRRRTQWHRRLMFCAMTMLLGPGFGRILPMPFLIPWAGEAVFVPMILFPLAGIIRDLRRSGRVHPAWWWGAGAIIATQTAVSILPHTPAGPAVYALVTSGSPGGAVAPLAYPPFPGAPPAP